MMNISRFSMPTHREPSGFISSTAACSMVNRSHSKLQTCVGSRPANSSNLNFLPPTRNSSNVYKAEFCSKVPQEAVEAVIKVLVIDDEVDLTLVLVEWLSRIA